MLTMVFMEAKVLSRVSFCNQLWGCDAKRSGKTLNVYIDRAQERSRAFWTLTPRFFNSSATTGLTEQTYGEKSWGHRPSSDIFFHETAFFPIVVQTKAGINDSHSDGEPPGSLNRIFLKHFENGFTKEKFARFLFFTQVQTPVTFLAVNGGVLWRWGKHSLPTRGLGFAMCLVHQVLPIARGVPGWSNIQVLTPLAIDVASLRRSGLETGVCHEAEEKYWEQKQKRKTWC